MRMSAAMQRRIHRYERERLERKRQAILYSMDAEARVQYADASLVDLILLRQTGRLNMLPGLDDPDDLS